MIFLLFRLGSARVLGIMFLAVVLGGFVGAHFGPAPGVFAGVIFAAMLAGGPGRRR